MYSEILSNQHHEIRLPHSIHHQTHRCPHVGETHHPAQPGLEGPERNGLDHQSQASHVQQGLQQNQPGLYAYTDLDDGDSAFVDCHGPIFQFMLG